MRHIALLLAAAASISMSSAKADMRITGDTGGLILQYADRFTQARQSGERIVIDGACLSACTLAIAMVPREQVCATSRAVLGFHAAWRPSASGGRAASPEATRAMMELYPTEVRQWIGRHGGLTTHMIYLRGRELTAIVPDCGTTAVAAGGGGSVAVARTRRVPGAVARAGSQTRTVARAVRDPSVLRPEMPRPRLASQQWR
jgi:hypothetical protein